jgi:hypothetical protein
VLLEKMAQPGRKINISGKGRCNITNTAELPAFLARFGKNGKFLRQSFQQFFSQDLIRFFEERGLETVTERGGRVFPAQGRAADVVGVFRDWLGQLPVSLRPASRVEELLIEDGHLRGVLCNGNAVLGRAVILATGGASYPATGSSGDGYRLAAAVGHSIVPIRPALVPVETSGGLAARLAGLQLRNVGVRLLINGKRKEDAFGELLFMKYGLSGPVILTLSKLMVDALRAGEQVSLLLDLKPALDEQKLDARLLRDFTERLQSKRCAGLYLAGEVLDLQADTGGYNLQAAFSTGWVAGKSAAAQLKEEAHGL